MIQNQYTEATRRIIEAIRSIPYGQVDSYGRIAERAGMPRGARQVVRILSSLSEKENLPWHRVVNAQLVISLKGEGASVQQERLAAEGVEVIGGKISKAYQRQ